MAQYAQSADRHVGSVTFLCGADMEPTAIRQRYPAAHFVARARWQPGAAWPTWYPLATAIPAAIWGILVDLTEPVTGPSVTVETDDGRVIAATLGTNAATVGDLAAVLANGRYWELTPVFVRQLQEATGQPMVEAPEG